MSGVHVIEQAVVAKSGNPEECEDGVVVTDGFAAVVDGATDKTGRRYDGLTGGRFVMLTVTETLRRLPADIDAYEAVDSISADIDKRVGTIRLPIEDLPSASATVYSVSRREIWQIGDVNYWFAGQPTRQSRKRVDQINTAMRVSVLKAELLRGVSSEELEERDPGREAILPLLTRQGLFANNTGAGDLAYAVLDGRSVPAELISVIPVPDSVGEVILASDGYPVILPTLAETESALKTMLAEDPLCIGRLSGTKAPRAGSHGYDDRSYVRFAL